MASWEWGWGRLLSLWCLLLMNFLFFFFTQWQSVTGQADHWVRSWSWQEVGSCHAQVKALWTQAQNTLGICKDRLCYGHTVPELVQHTWGAATVMIRKWEGLSLKVNNQVLALSWDWTFCEVLFGTVEQNLLWLGRCWVTKASSGDLTGVTASPVAPMWVLETLC